MTAQFSIREADPQIVARLAHDLGLPRFIATTLVARGITTVRAAKRFLNPSLDRDWRNPLEIPGLAEVADGLIDAIREKKRIVVFGDFDLDGISATTVLTGACGPSAPARSPSFPAVSRKATASPRPPSSAPELWSPTSSSPWIAALPARARWPTS